MAIEFKQDKNIFHLKSKNTSYIIKIVNDKYPAHLYWGKKLSGSLDFEDKIIYGDRPVMTVIKEDNLSLELLPQEYPAYGNTDYGVPGYKILQENGSRTTNALYSEHRIYKDKTELTGLPASYAEADDNVESLEIDLVDQTADFKITLTYTVFADYDIITRSAKIINTGQKNLRLQSALSISLDFEDSDFEMLQLSGAWGRERHLKTRSLVQGLQQIESKRGASSHYQNPFIALSRPNTDEFQGEVYAANLVYSGNFKASVEVNHYERTRLSLGINDFDFSWLLEAGEEFQAPEAVLAYSDQGLNQMSQLYHKFYRERLVKSKFKDQERPVLLNNWEGTYFDFNEDKIVEIAASAAELGVELFVLDDGWFGRRNDDTSSLGDWYVNKNKLPNGVSGLAEKINDLGLAFGIWVEPEMVSPDSDLYREHSDWVIEVPDRPNSEGRNQLILDFSRREVQDYIIDVLSELFAGANISYVKWDMNRNMTEIGSNKLAAARQEETAHRYILGLYRVLEKLTSKFPDILFESCASGGGRFDPGMLYYMPQTWTSDDTDAVERLKIQYGTSLVYPVSAMGTHISAVPNHQLGRITSLDMRANTAYYGAFGYELDPTEMSFKEREIVKAQIKKFKSLRNLIQFGDFYRLLSPFAGNECAWMTVSDDQKEAFVSYYKILAEANVFSGKIKLQGLNPDYDYQIKELNKTFSGSQLLYSGLPIGELKQEDFSSKSWHLQVI
ncbi:alpha-galactosidase [Halanaerobium saccharolyticum]|uniref:alpha-galactosidase n=1 Tax=Halanaerobium saccharolyticum TaxID=43595 RepID=UPI003FCE44F6